MISKTKNLVLSGLRRIGSFIAAVVLMSAANVMQAQSPKVKAENAFNGARAAEQPLYSDYKGVRIGMAADEVRSKLGQPSLKGEDQDYFAFSDRETAQIAYDAAHKATTISVDFLGGVGAPDPKSVVGGNLETKNGAEYKLVRYESLGFWVSYNRSAGPMVVVTITIQKMQKL
jgi:hypothetical protein